MAHAITLKDFFLQPVAQRLCPPPEREGGGICGTTSSVVRTFAFKPRPGSGRDCLICAIFARRRQRTCAPGRLFWLKLRLMLMAHAITLKDFFLQPVAQRLCPPPEREGWGGLILAPSLNPEP